MKTKPLTRKMLEKAIKKAYRDSGPEQEYSFWYGRAKALEWVLKRWPETQRRKPQPKRTNP